jgi:hypothetical protein
MRFAHALAFAAAALWLAPAAAQAPGYAPAAAGLHERYAALRERFEQSPYGRPLWLDSREGAHNLEGDAFAVIAQPFGKVMSALGPLDHWCDALILPFNVKRCTTNAAAARLSLWVSPKADSSESLASRLDFEYSIAAHANDYLELALRARDGPLGTRDYRIVLRAIPLDEGRTFIHLGYSYGFGVLGKAAMRTYLATAGASKVGFSRDGQGFVGGMRGVMERNTMRYYLAIDAYLGSLAAPPAAQAAKRLNDWFSATERYPRQLGENIGRAQYIAMKMRVN